MPVLPNLRLLNGIPDLFGNLLLFFYRHGSFQCVQWGLLFELNFTSNPMRRTLCRHGFQPGIPQQILTASVGGADAEILLSPSPPVLLWCSDKTPAICHPDMEKQMSCWSREGKGGELDGLFWSASCCQAVWLSGRVQRVAVYVGGDFLSWRDG